MPQYIPTETLFGTQWYLRNTGQTGFGPGNLDLNVTYVWPDYTGAGVKVAVYDDGVDFNHVDLAANYDHALDVIIDGSPSDANFLQPGQVGGTTGFNSLNAHGTTIAGTIAAENNGVGTVGVAFDSTIVGVYSPMTFPSNTPTSQLVQALQQMKNFDVVDFANSGNAFHDGQGNTNYASFYAAIQSAATDGRGGLGTILVNSEHNSGPGFGGVDGNSSGFDANRFYIHVGGVLDTGDVGSYVTRGSNMLVSAFASAQAVGSGSARNIWTTDITGADGIGPGDYVDSGGTSLAAPQVAGTAALMLQANPNLGWRDVQNILSQSARHTGSDIGGSLHPSETGPWQFNGADNWNGGGRHYSIDYGYGVIDALAAVRMAETWNVTGTPAGTSANQVVKSATIDSGSLAIPDNTGSSVTLNFNVTDNIHLDNVRLLLGVTDSRIEDLTITLISPDGTTSKIFNPVSSEAGTGHSVTSWGFDSEEFRGELSQGTWQVVITDHVSGHTGTLGSSTLQLFGSSNITSTRYVYTNEFHNYADLGSRSTLTDTDGGSDTINAAAVTSASHIDLNQGAASTIDGHSLTIAVGTDIENAIGGDGNDTLIGNSLDNILDGGRGTNSIDGGSGNDTAAFLLGRDSYTIQHVGSTLVVTGPESIDTLTSIEHLQFADATYDVNEPPHALVGGPGPDSLAGGLGDDILDGKDGNDTMTGGAGNDLYYVQDTGDTIVEKPGEGLDSVIAYVSYTLPANVEAIYTLAGSGATGNGGDNLLDGAYAGSGQTLDGQGGNDVIYGTFFDDTLEGGAGSDALYDIGGNDTMQGGSGDDAYFVNSTADVVQENAGEGQDAIYASVNFTLPTNVEILEPYSAATRGDGNDDANVLLGVASDHGLTLDGHGGNDVIYGSNFDDTLIGGAGDDLLWGFGGNDTMQGGTGNDTYIVEQAGDLVQENSGEGNDTVYASVNFTLPANVENLFVYGGATTGTGNGDDNFIVNEFITTGVTLTGAGGNDTFVFIPGTANNTTITDFAGNGASAGDVLEFAAYGAGATFTNIDATHWQVNYGAGLSQHDVITFSNAPSIDTVHDVLFV